jgi:hypothetical protein
LVSGNFIFKISMESILQIIIFSFFAPLIYWTFLREFFQKELLDKLEENERNDDSFISDGPNEYEGEEVNLIEDYYE